MSYNYSLTTFSPTGKLGQIEHALNAVNNGHLSVGIKVPSGVVIAAVKPSISPLVDESTVEKVFTVCRTSGIVYSGLGPDARVLAMYARKRAQSYKLRFGEYPPGLVLAKELSEVMQEFTMSGGVRPFGTSLLIASSDHKGPVLAQLDPSGAYFCWSATALGKNSAQAKQWLERRYTSEMSLEDAIQMAILALKDNFDGELGATNVEIGICEENDFKQLTVGEVGDYFSNL